MIELFKELAELIKTKIKGTFLEFLSPYVTIILLVLVAIIIPLLWKLLKSLYSYTMLRDNYSEKLYPYLTREEVKYSTRYYINTRCQNIPPNNELEPIDNFGFAVTKKLRPFIYYELFKSSSDVNKYTLILGDTGMGKTTFLINLVKKYYYKPWKKRYQIALFPLGTPFINQKLKEFPSTEASKTVLLLDALDEDAKAVINYEDRIKELLDITYYFKKVIITCRTQFFPSEGQEPVETEIEMFGSNKGSYKFRKIYLSPFTEGDVKFYLYKRFGFNIPKIRKAYKLVKQSQFLMVRPFLLSYIDEIVHINKAMEYSYKVYEFLVNKWIEREASKIDANRKEEFKKELYDFSKNLAINMYLNQKKRGGLFISIDEINSFAVANKIKLNELELRGRSLLNRNKDNYKFAHKSILEYFLSLELYENQLFLSTFHFEGMDQARVFYRQQCASKAFAENMHSASLNSTVKQPLLLAVLVEKFRVNYENIKSLKELTSLKEYTLLNPDEFDERFFQGMLFVEHINLLITSDNSIRFLHNAPALKSITILNKNIHLKSSLEGINYTSSYHFREKLLHEIYHSFHYLNLYSKTEYKKSDFQYTHDLSDRINDYFSHYFTNITNILKERKIEVRTEVSDPKDKGEATNEFINLIRNYMAETEETNN